MTLASFTCLHFLTGQPFPGLSPRPGLREAKGPLLALISPNPVLAWSLAEVQGAGRVCVCVFLAGGFSYRHF